MIALAERRATAEAIREGWLRLVALRWELRARLAEADTQDDHGDAAGWASWRSAMSGLVSELDRHDEARPLLEDACLGGRTTLFPDAAAEWRALRDAARTLASPGPAGATDGPTGPDASELAQAMAERARAQALDLLGRPADGGLVVARLLWGSTVGTAA